MAAVFLERYPGSDPAGTRFCAAVSHIRPMLSAVPRSRWGAHFDGPAQYLYTALCVAVPAIKAAAGGGRRSKNEKPAGAQPRSALLHYSIGGLSIAINCFKARPCSTQTH